MSIHVITSILQLTFDYLSLLHFQNAEMSFNFGTSSFNYQPQGYTALFKAPKDCTSESKIAGSGPAVSKPAPNAPQAIIIEPSRELAEQVCRLKKNNLYVFPHPHLPKGWM